MKIFQKIIFLIITISFFTSCKKNEFQVINSEIKIPSKSEILNLEKVKNELIFLDGAGLLEYEYTNGYEMSEIERNKLFKKNRETVLNEFKVINSKLEIKNNTKEVIENSYLTIRIIFKFKNKHYEYLKPYSLLSSYKTWKSDETLNLNLNEILTYATGNTKVLNIHKPENIFIEFYLTAKNSIGYQNIDEKIEELRVSGFYNQEDFPFGKFTDKTLNEKQISGLGQKIFDKNITDLWNEKSIESENDIISSKEEKVKKNDNGSSLKIYEVQNAIQISMPSDLELRDENSDIGKAMNDFRDEYNESNISKIGKSNLVFQPKGTNNNEKNAASDVTRITVAYFKIEKNSFPKWNDNLASQNTNSTNELFKQEVIKSMKEMSFDAELLNWNPIETGTTNELSYLKTSYSYLVNNEKTYTESYQFFNSNEKVIISLTTDFPYKKKWKKVFEESINTFKFNTKK